MEEEKKRYCKKCGETKDVSKFEMYRHHSKKDVFLPTNRCKSCKMKHNNAWRKAKRDEEKKYYWVYYLPEEHYVGITSNVKNRIATHIRDGRITEGYELVVKCRHPARALMIEAILHLKGYYGCNYKYYP